MSNVDPFQILWDKTCKEIPGARIVMKKDSLFMTIVFGFLKAMVFVFTLGQGRKEWDGFTSTIWRTMYVPDSWESRNPTRKYMTLRHELMHMRQFRNWPLKFLGRTKHLWRINAIITSVCYLFLPLPVFFTFRAKFEREGYTQSMLVRHELFESWNDEKDRKDYQDFMVKTFGTSTYMWMWFKGRARKWAVKTMDDISYGKITNYTDRVVAGVRVAK